MTESPIQPKDLINRFNEELGKPLPPESDVYARYCEVIRRLAIFEAGTLYRGFIYAANCKNAAEYDERQFVTNENGLVELAEMMADVRKKMSEAEREPIFSIAKEPLRMMGEQYFALLSTKCPVKSVGACHMLFSAIVSDLGSDAAIEHAKILVEDRRAMCREINLSSFKAEIGQQLATVTETLENVDKSVAKFDRRQTESLSLIKKLVTGFVNLFRPGAQTPSLQKVQRTLAPSSRYDCLAKVTEPHRSQIMAVIDYTWNKRAIVFKSKKGDERAYTLAHAVRDVWLENHNTWDNIPGAYPSMETLKAACYHFQGGDNDPFNYAKTK